MDVGQGYDIGLSLGGNLYNELKLIQGEVRKLHEIVKSIKSMTRGGLFSTRSLNTQAGHLVLYASVQRYTLLHSLLN